MKLFTRYMYGYHPSNKVCSHPKLQFWALGSFQADAEEVKE